MALEKTQPALSFPTDVGSIILVTPDEKRGSVLCSLAVTPHLFGDDDGGVAMALEAEALTTARQAEIRALVANDLARSSRTRGRREP